MTHRALAATLLTFLATIPWPIAAEAQSPRPFADAAAAAAQCAQLTGVALDKLPDATTKVDAAKVVVATPDLPAYCQVQATIKPAVGIELRLPTAAWNGKFFEYARGGLCRPISMDDCDTPLRKGYACVITDHGNKTGQSDEAWMYGNVQARTDCGFRATHVAAVAGKALTERYYGVAPRYAYLMGCSTGGRLAMTEAVKFPTDFDGVIAGAPPISKYPNALSLTWNARAVLDRDGRQILFPEDVRLVAKAALAQCDGKDGLEDKVISDPMACKVDLTPLACRDGRTADCLSPAKIEAVRKLYAGPVNSKGQRLYNAAQMPGSELNWIDAYVTQDGSPSPIRKSMNVTLRYLTEPERGPDFDILQFDWDRDASTIWPNEAFSTAANPDLRAFKAAGGKLIAYHGLADPLVLPGAYIDYYQTVERTMGGAAETQDFFRLFAMPGLNHCTGGAGGQVADYIRYLEDWVERGQAPTMIVASHLKDGADPKLLRRLTVDPATVAFTRPIYPYPLVTRYKGKGDPNDAASFTAAPSMAQSAPP